MTRTTIAALWTKYDAASDALTAYLDRDFGYLAVDDEGYTPGARVVRDMQNELEAAGFSIEAATVRIEEITAKVATKFYNRAPARAETDLSASGLEYIGNYDDETGPFYSAQA